MTYMTQIICDVVCCDAWCDLWWSRIPPSPGSRIAPSLSLLTPRYEADSGWLIIYIYCFWASARKIWRQPRKKRSRVRPVPAPTVTTPILVHPTVECNLAVRRGRKAVATWMIWFWLHCFLSFSNSVLPFQRFWIESRISRHNLSFDYWLWTLDFTQYSTHWLWLIQQS